MPHFADTEPHALILLLDDSEPPVCLHLWRDEVPPSFPQPGELLPLPDSAVTAAGGNVEPAGQVEASYVPSRLPDDIRNLLPVAPAAACRTIVLLRLLTPEVSSDGFVSVGEFDPADAKQLLRLFEEHEIPFEVDADHSALLQPGRSVAMFLGMYPPGSRLQLFVPELHLAHARKLIQHLYPPEKPPVARRSSDTAPLPPAVPAMEVYTPPSAEITGQDRRDFYASPGEEPNEDIAGNQR